MSERLTKWEVDWCASVNGCSPIDADMAKAINRLCDLEDKIEQGKIVELPCAVGQIVYEVQPMRARTQGYKITTAKWNGCYWWFTWVVKDRNGIYVNIDGFSSHQIGKTVFLDRATAEAKLREMEGEDNGKS